MRKRILVKRFVAVGAAAVVASAAFVPGAFAEGTPIDASASNSHTVPIPSVGSKVVTLNRNGQVHSFVTPYLQNATLTVTYVWKTATSAPTATPIQCPGGGGVGLSIASLSNDGSVWGLLAGEIGDSTATSGSASQTAPGGHYEQEFGSGAITHDPTAPDNTVLTVCDA